MLSIYKRYDNKEYISYSVVIHMNCKEVCVTTFKKAKASRISSGWVTSLFINNMNGRTVGRWNATREWHCLLIPMNFKIFFGDGYK